MKGKMILNQRSPVLNDCSIQIITLFIWMAISVIDLTLILISLQPSEILKAFVTYFELWNLLSMSRLAPKPCFIQ